MLKSAAAAEHKHTHSLNWTPVHKGRAQQRAHSQGQKGPRAACDFNWASKIRCRGVTSRILAFSNWCEAFPRLAGDAWREPARLFSSHSLASPMCVSKECVTPAEKNYYQTPWLLLLLFKGSNNCALQTHKKYTHRTLLRGSSYTQQAYLVFTPTICGWWWCGVIFTSVAAKYTKNIFPSRFCSCLSYSLYTISCPAWSRCCFFLRSL